MGAARLQNRHRLPLGLLGTLALVLATEAAVATRADSLASYQALGVRFASRRAERSAPGCAVLGLGDSQMKFGFDPAEIERRLGLRAYNLAVPGTPPPLALGLLRRALRAGAKPRAIVLGHMTLSGEPRANLAEFGELLGPGEILELAVACHDADLLARLLLARWLPSRRYRHTLQAGVLADLRAGVQGASPAAGPGTEARAFLRTWEANRGAELRPADGRFDGRMEPQRERTVYSGPWQVYSVYEKYLRRTAELAASQGIAVFWLVGPIIPEAQARRDSLGLDAHHTRNLRAVMARMPNVIVLDARHAGFPASAFFDSCHLNAEGARALSGSIAEVIREHLSAGPKARRAGSDRWVELSRAVLPARIATGGALRGGSSSR
jgi:hypothetical protein